MLFNARWEDARATFGVALALNPDGYSAFQGLMLRHMQRGDSAEAESWMARATELRGADRAGASQLTQMGFALAGWA